MFCFCKKKKNPSISGTVTLIDSYGSVHVSFTIELMLKRGFDYGDIIKCEFEKSGTFIMPITTAYTEVGIGKPSFCHYSKVGEASFGYCQGDFHRMCGGIIGEKIKILMYQKQGYIIPYSLLLSVYYYDRSLYPSDEAFANFREIKTTGIKPNTLYRSSNPINLKSNPVRYQYADKLAKQVGIKSEIDIANNIDQVQSYIDDQEMNSIYCPKLFKTGGEACLYMGSDTFCDTAYMKFALGMRHIINTDGPYLIHCNEGKDRCGFFCILLESLAGASLTELEEDYMTTFENLYNFKRDTEEYKLNLALTGRRLIWLMKNPDDINKVDLGWNLIIENPDLDNDTKMKCLIKGINCGTDEDPYSKIIPQEAAESFLLNKCFMTKEEINILKSKICN